jgi:aromatic ring-opening dioxygenase LigB subunit
VTVVMAAIAPHGDLVVPELCGEASAGVALTTQSAMRQLETRARTAAPDVVMIVSPHHLHLERSFGVVTAGRLAGELWPSETGSTRLSDDPGGRIALDCAVDRVMARTVLDALASAGLPATGVSYGGNAADEAVMPMDWGTLIPLWYLGGRWDTPPQVVLLTPARDLAPSTHVEAGRVIGRLLAASPRRVLFIASADQSHTHDPDGPYGFDHSAAVFDQMVVEAVRANDLAGLRSVSPELIESAKPDAWWQLLILDGVLEATGTVWEAELLAYEAPTYYGMATAAFVPRGWQTSDGMRGERQ